MDKNAIKKYAVWARRELISRVSQRAALYEITADGYGDQNAASVHGRIMSTDEKKQRIALINQIKEKGYEQVMEEIAYTWFNRFSALRFMEVNGYLPTRIRVFTDDENNFKPQILTEAINMELDGLDMQKVYDLKNANDDDSLFKYLIITQCNALSSILPGMFQRISDYTELLFPDNLLREGSVIEQMTAMIPQEDWTDQVQIIGWLYQYYNTEPKDKVFANLKKNIKISKENIPAATQLFTPEWIVRYMVENSLGRLWLEGHPNDDLKAEWKYYLDEAEQEPEVQELLAEIRKEYAALKPEDILAIDPCQGSGHILAYMFDVLVQIYEAYGYSEREAASSIVEHNIWGLDIDERAAQLAYFSVMMKARQYDRRFFSRGIQPHVYAIQESNNLDLHCIEYFVDGREELRCALNSLVKELQDAKEYGSILKVTYIDFENLYSRFEEIRTEPIPSIYNSYIIDILLPFVHVAHALAQQYDVVVTNPPYAAVAGMSSSIVSYVKKNYPNSKSDLFAVFIERCLQLLKHNGCCSMITQHSWMFLSDFKKLRSLILNYQITNMAHLGAKAFEEIAGEVVQTTAFTIRKSYIENEISVYHRLINYNSQSEKEISYLQGKNRFEVKQNNFRKIDSNIIAYWISDKVFKILSSDDTLEKFGSARQGLATTDNKKYLRLWTEIDFNKIDFCCDNCSQTIERHSKWFPYNKAGQFRKWSNINEYVVNYENNGSSIKKDVLRKYPYLKTPGFVVKNTEYYFKHGITWNDVSTNSFCCRYVPNGFIFDAAGPMYFSNTDKLMLGYFNSKVFQVFADIICQGLHYSTGHIPHIPYRDPINYKDNIEELVEENLVISQRDWDSYETSWGFLKHPLIRPVATLKDAYDEWSAECNKQFIQLKHNEEELNRFFIDIYGLQDELTPEVDDKDVTVRKANLSRDIRSFVSYSVGCMLGRYSPFYEGLQYAGGDWGKIEGKLTKSNYMPDRDAIIPICDDEYFKDDIVNLFVEFVRVVYGTETLEENLSFIASALTSNSKPQIGSSRETIRNYFINDFYKDHCKIYQKRPIYWLFDSGKKNGFRCLIYMHRYQPDTIARIRTDYVHEQQARYRTAIADLENRVADAETGERVKLTKRLNTIKAQAEELRIYEEKIHHLADKMLKIDLDNGVKVNYTKFADVLAKIK